MAPKKPAKKKPKAKAKKHGGARDGAGRPKVVLTEVEIDAMFSGLDLKTHDGKLGAMHRADRWMLLGKLSDGKHKRLLESLRTQVLTEKDAGADRIAAIVAEATEIVKQTRGLTAGADVGEPPDDMDDDTRH